MHELINTGAALDLVNRRLEERRRLVALVSAQRTATSGSPRPDGRERPWYALLLKRILYAGIRRKVRKGVPGG
jgi:hypothetical protein